MSIFVNGKKVIDENDWKNTNIGTNLISGPVFSNTLIPQSGNSKDFTFSAPKKFDWTFQLFPLNCSFKKGDIFTISAFATLTGSNNNGLYKASILSRDYQIVYDPNADTDWLKAGQVCSKTITVNADSDPNNPPYLSIYSGVAGSTGGNTIHVQNLKIEHGSIATQWSPAPEDLVLKSDFDALKAKVDSLTKSQNGGDN